MPPEDPHPPIADYELLRRIGRGSYGDVWLARGATGLYRAVKIVWRNRFSDVGPYEREFKGLSDFMRLTRGELRQLALLHVGRDEDRGFFYYVMELADDVVTGNQIDPTCYEPLTLKGLRDSAEHLSAERVLSYGIELAAGLDELHRAGLIHRDIKPSNIILVDGQPKLADIGLVSTEKEAHTFVGTEGFVPPEGPGSQAADIFSLGKVLYEVATGHDRHDFPRLPINLSEREDRAEYLELNEVIIKAAAPDRADRYLSAVALRDELQLLAAGKSVRRLRFAEAGMVRARKWIFLAVIVAMVAGAGALVERRRADVESTGRRAAEAELADLTRRTLHDASLAAAQRALETGNYGVAREALERALPQSGGSDLRGFEWHALYREAQGDPAEIIRKSGGNVTRLEASPDGRWIAVDHHSPHIELYDQETGGFVKSLQGIHRIAGFSPDGKRLVGTNPEYAIETWSIADGRPDGVPAKPRVNRPLQVHPELPHLLYFEDGPEAQDHRFGIWNYESGEDVVVWPIAKIGENGLSTFFSGSASRDLSKAMLVTVSNLTGVRSYLLQIFDMKSGEMITFEKSETALDNAHISPEGDRYVCRTGTLKIRDINRPQSTAIITPHESLSGQVVFNKKGTEFITGGSDHRLVVVDSQTGAALREFKGSGSQIDRMTYAADHNKIWSVDQGGELRRWRRDVRQAPPVTTTVPMPPESRLNQLKFNQTSDHLAVVNANREMVLLKTSDLSPDWQRAGIESVVLVDDEEVMVLSSGKKLRRLSISSGEEIGAFSPFDSNTKINAVTLSPNNRLLLAFSEHDQVALFNLDSDKLLAEYDARQLGGQGSRIPKCRDER